MNQKFAILRKRNLINYKGTTYECRTFRSTSLSKVCIECGYNSKKVDSEICPKCREPLYEYHTSTKIPKFKSKKWNDFVNLIFYYRLKDMLTFRFNSKLFHHNNMPLKDKSKIYFLDDDFKKLIRYDINFCRKNNICPDLSTRSGRYFKQEISKSTQPFY